MTSEFYFLVDCDGIIWTTESYSWYWIYSPEPKAKPLGPPLTAKEASNQFIYFNGELWGYIKHPSSPGTKTEFKNGDMVYEWF